MTPRILPKLALLAGLVVAGWPAVARAQLDFLLSPQKTQSTNNLKNLALGFHNYAATYNHFPSPIGTSAKTPKEELAKAKPLLSWRVQLLPYLEENALYDSFKLDEPWDSDHNKKLIEKMPKLLAAPGGKVAKEFKTNYLMPRHEKAIPANARLDFGDIRDGTSNTILIVEVSDERAVIWTKPDDLELDLEKPLAGLVGLRKGSFLAAFMDGSVRTLDERLPADTLKAIFTRSGAEVIGSLDAPPRR